MKVVYLCMLLMSAIILVSCSNNTENDVQDSSRYTLINHSLEQIEISDSETLLFMDISDNKVLWMMTSSEEGYSVYFLPFESMPKSNMTDILASAILFTQFTSSHNVLGFTVTESAAYVSRASGNELNVSRINMDGNIEYDVSTMLDGVDEFRLIATIVDRNGLFYAAFRQESEMDSYIAVFSRSGELLFKLESYDNAINDLALSDRGVLVLMHDSSIREIDIENRRWGDSFQLDDLYVRITGSHNGDVFLSNFHSLAILDQEMNDTTQIIDFTRMGIMPFWILPIMDDNFIVGAISGVYYVGATVEETLSELAMNDNTITLALTPGLSVPPYIFSKVNNFNSENEELKIELREISEDTVSLFLTELAIGRMPDMIYYSSAWDPMRMNVPPQRLAVLGYLADLFPFIDSDPQLNRESFVQNLVEASTVNDALYELPYRFWLDIAVGEGTLLGSEMGWTFEELINLLDNTAFDGYLLNKNITQDELLSSMLRFLLDDFIDWFNGDVYFESPKFITLLEIAKRYAPERDSGMAFYEWDEIEAGNQLMMWQTMAEPNFLQFLDYHFTDMVPIGFPVSEGVGHAFNHDSSFVISSTSQYKQESWGFIRQFYSYEFWENNQGLLPSNVEALESFFAIRDNIWGIGIGDWEIFVEGNTPHDVERTWEIINNTTRISRVNRDVFFIILEEANFFFRGHRSAVDTARIIQSRVQTYVWEQVG